DSRALRSKSLRPMPDWLDATATVKPLAESRAMASRLPSIGFHSAGDLMNSSESWLMTPSLSSTIKRKAGTVTKSAAPSANGQARDVRDVEKQAAQSGQQGQPVAP